MVQSAEDFYWLPEHLAGVPGSERVLFRMRAGGVDFPLPEGVDEDHPVTDVRIDAGRWMADCPCGSAQVLARDDPQPKFYCPRCFNSGTRLWRPIVWPEDTENIEDQVTATGATPRDQFWRREAGVYGHRPPPERKPRERPRASQPARRKSP